MPTPDQNLLDIEAAVVRHRERLVRLDLVVEQLAFAVVAVHRHQDATLRVGDPPAARGTAEPAEHLRVDDAKAGARKHRDRQLGDHWQVEGDPVTGLHATEVPEECRELVHPTVELLVGDRFRLLVLGLRHPDERRLVVARSQMAVDAVEAGVQASADEPLPERGVAGVKRRVPVRVPIEQVRVLLEALREVLLAETLEDGRIGRVRLRDERRWGVEVFLLPPVNSDLSLGDLDLLCYLHFSTSR